MGRVTDEGVLNYIPGSNELGSLFSGVRGTAASVGLSVLSGVSGRHMYYRHLVSARATRDVLKGHSGGVTGMARVIGSMPASALRSCGDALGL